MSSRKQSAEIKEKEFGRRTRKIHSTEEKIKVVLEGLKEQTDIAELCRKENITINLYRSWSKEFIEAGKRRLNGDFKSDLANSEVQNLRKENLDLKQLVAELTLEVRTLKKHLNGSF
jgi:transposase